jgi:hypothetical protein
MQLDIDLAAARSLTAKADCNCTQMTAGLLTVSPKGYVLFFASKGTGGYAVTVGDAREKERPVFDSQNLTTNDLFVLSLLEPTAYHMRNSLGTAKGEILITFSPKDGPRLKSLKTEMVEVGKEKFNPAQVRLTATQGLVFRVTDSARIVIEPKTRGRKEPPSPSPRRFRPIVPRPHK